MLFVRPLTCIAWESTQSYNSLLWSLFCQSAGLSRGIREWEGQCIMGGEMAFRLCDEKVNVLR